MAESAHEPLLKVAGILIICGVVVHQVVPGRRTAAPLFGPLAPFDHAISRPVDVAFRLVHSLADVRHKLVARLVSFPWQKKRKQEPGTCC